MAIKTHKVTLSLDNPRVIQSGINAQSFDKQSIQISIELTKNDEVFRVPSDATIRVSLLKLARQEQKIIVDVPNTNRDSIDWIVPDYLDGYQGTVRVGVYLVSGAENVDLGYFTILSNVSDIDKMADEFVDNVFQGWEQIEADLNELNLTIAQTKLDLAEDLTQIDDTIANINALASDFTTDVATKQTDVTSKYNAFDADITEANQTIDDILALQPQFQAVLDETTGKDVISAPELIAARNGKSNLKTRLDDEHAQVTAQLAQKATITDVQKISLSYKESYTTLALLQAAYPSGDIYNHVVLANNMIYTYKNGWVSTQIQANGTGIANKSIDISKMEVGLQSALLSNMIENTVSGTLLSLTNYVKGSDLEYTASEDATKIITSGKNLLNPLLFTKTHCTISIDDNIITVTNPKAYGVPESITTFLAKGTYTLSSSKSFGIAVRKTDDTYLHGMNAGVNQKVTFTLTESANYKFGFSIGASLTDTIVDLMLVVGNVKTDYKPFTKKVEYAVGEQIVSDDTIMTDGTNINVTYKTNTVKDDVVPLPYTNPLFEKKLAIAGDSIAFGAGATGGFGRYIAEQNNMSLHNVAVSGATITANVKDSSQNIKPCISDMVDTLDSNSDYVILEGSVNDYALIGLDAEKYGMYNMNSYDVALNADTFLGAFEKMLRNSVNRFIGKKILFVFVHGIFRWNTSYYTTWRTDMINLLNKYGVPYLELDKMVPPLCNVESYKTLYTANSDGWHPNELGYKTFYVRQIEEKLKTI